MTLKAPFPWFGGKSRVAAVVWQRFGNTDNYVEPFAGSLAVLTKFEIGLTMSDAQKAIDLLAIRLEASA